MLSYQKIFALGQLEHSSVLFFLVVNILFAPSVAVALCVMETPTSLIRASTSLVSGGNNRVELKGILMNTSISFRCDKDTDYILAIVQNESASTNNTLTLYGPGSDKISVSPRVKTVNSKVVNMYFREMVGGVYAGRAVAGEPNRVQIEFEPSQINLQDKTLKGNGLFNGRAQFLIQY